ncbi:MAG: hypothetical protein IJ338_10995, partial [Bacteroidaceae bacterium]|nr:hypothetical protein [Bacteroidaceae bacterium]
MKNLIRSALLCMAAVTVATSCHDVSEANLYITTADQSIIFKKITLKSGKTPENTPIIRLNPQERFQTMDGFGA